MSHKLDFFASAFSIPPIRAFKKKKQSLMWRLAVVAIAFAMGAMPALAQSTPLAEDSFDYPEGPLNGKGSATDPGWLGPWDGNAYVTGAPSLMYIDTSGNRLITHGSRVRAPGFSYRQLETPLEYPTYSEVWISFVGYSVGRNLSLQFRPGITLHGQAGGS
jgi:hypothetical protein